MTARLIYLVGQPGSGKSTLMSKLTAAFDRHKIAPNDAYPVAHDVLTERVTGEVVGAELGVRRELFSGTDALPSSIIDKAAPWVRSQPYPLLLAEGARLANRRFIDAALEGGYEVTLVLLDHNDAEDWRKVRSKAIGKTQNPSWVKGRLSASRNLADTLTGPAYQGKAVSVVRGHPDPILSVLKTGVPELRL
jgi:hypothetical protein